MCTDLYPLPWGSKEMILDCPIEKRTTGIWCYSAEPWINSESAVPRRSLSVFCAHVSLRLQGRGCALCIPCTATTKYEPLSHDVAATPYAPSNQPHLRNSSKGNRPTSGPTCRPPLVPPFYEHTAPPVYIHVRSPASVGPPVIRRLPSDPTLAPHRTAPISPPPPPPPRLRFFFFLLVLSSHHPMVEGGAEDEVYRTSSSSTSLSLNWVWSISLRSSRGGGLT